jgi:RNA polymerase sigma-70 factor (ECF subfamily)
MSDAAPLESESFERFRDFLLMLARAQIGPKYRAKIDPEEIANQTLFDAYQQREQFRGSSEGQLVAWLRRMLGDNIKDAIRFLHRDKRDVDREEGPPVADWDRSCSQFLDITCGLTSPSMKVVKHERELQLARALSRLPEAQRDAVELRHLHGCSLAETAEALDRTAAAVIGLLRRGLKRLRELLQETTTGYR